MINKIFNSSSNTNIPLSTCFLNRKQSLSFSEISNTFDNGNINKNNKYCGNKKACQIMQKKMFSPQHLISSGNHSEGNRPQSNILLPTTPKDKNKRH